MGLPGHTQHFTLRFLQLVFYFIPSLAEQALVSILQGSDGIVGVEVDYNKIVTNDFATRELSLAEFVSAYRY